MNYKTPMLEYITGLLQFVMVSGIFSQLIGLLLFQLLVAILNNNNNKQNTQTITNKILFLGFVGPIIIISEITQ